MASRRRSLFLGVAALVAIGIALFFLPRSGLGVSAALTGSGDAASDTSTTPGGARTVTRSGPGGQARGTAAASPSGAARSEVLAELGWGSGPSELGRHRPQEASPEAPMSMAVDALGNMVVLDQINGRILRLDSEGKAVGTFPTAQQTPQDIAMARDGTLLVLDRLRDKTVAILDPDTGAPRGELPVEGQGIPEGGLVTGTFVDGDSVYVEREHGALVRIGDTSGQADPERPEIPGRPTRDGRSYILAGITERRSGRLFLNAVDRQTGQHRYTREYRLDFPVMAITLLDSDLSGTIYLGVAGELPSLTAEPPGPYGVRVFCLEPLEGKVIGQTDLPVNSMPEETFRDFSVLDAGGIVYRHITESGVTLMRARCR